MTDTQPRVFAEIVVDDGCKISTKADADDVVLEIGGQGFGDAPIQLTIADGMIDSLITAATEARDRLRAAQLRVEALR